MTSDHPADVEIARKKGLSGASELETRETPAGDEDGGTMRLRRRVGDVEPAPDAFQRVLARRDRKRRNQRVAVGVLRHRGVRPRNGRWDPAHVLRSLPTDQC